MPNSTVPAAAIGLPNLRLRLRIEAAIERMIAALDTFDADPDLEEGYDAEDVCEDEGAQCDDEGSPDNEDGDLSDSEPSLGALSEHSHGNQVQWGRNDPYGGSDREFEPSVAKPKARQTGASR